MHGNVPGAPFGGVGDSGHGYYHGRHGLLSFSYQRTVIATPSWLDRLIGFRYPPFDYAKNSGKIDVGAKVWFKKRETMEEQVIKKKGGWGWWLQLLGLVICFLATYRWGAYMGGAGHGEYI